MTIWISEDVAQDQLGNSEEAQRLVKEMRKTWPEFPSEFLADKIFQNDGETRNAIFETLKKYLQIQPRATHRKGMFCKAPFA